MDDTLVIKLKRPIEVADLRVDEITLTEPTGGQVDEATSLNASTLRQSMKLVSLVSGLPVAVIERLPISAQRKADKFLADFIADAGE